MSVAPRFTPPVARDKRGWALALFGAAAGFMLFLGVAPHVVVSPFVAYAAGFASVVAATLSVSRFAPVAPREAGAVAVAALVAIAAAYAARAWGWPSAFAMALALLAGGSALGALVGARIEHPGHLLFVALASSVADTFSVASPEGPSAAIARSETALSLAAVSWPMLGTPAIEPFLGVGDIVFSGLYFACARRHAFALHRTWIALASGYAATMFAVLTLQIPIPALPFLGGAMLVAHPEARRPPVAERRRGLLVLSVMTALFLALLFRPRD